VAGPRESLGRLQAAYTGAVRDAAGRAMQRLGETQVTPNMLSGAGLALCVVGSVLVYLEHRAWWLFLLGSFVFFVGSVLDILDGALARSVGKGTPFGSFVDSTVDRIGEGFMLGAIGLVLMRDGNEWAVALTIAAVAGSFLVSYTRAKAENLGLRGDVGLGGRAERVAMICIGVACGSVGSLPWLIVALTSTAWVTVLQRMLSVRAQLRQRGHEEPVPPNP
jgi:CDP-diacylglycerol--glycerol-3-phosphate 3-phosphatidyltransferase